MNTFDREDRMRRMMGGFTQEEQAVKKVSSGAVVLVILLRFAVAVCAIALVDVSVDGDYDLSLWGMTRMAVGGFFILGLLASSIAEAVVTRMSQQ